MSFPRLTVPLFLPLAMALALLTGACGAPLVVTGAGYAADGSLLATTDKTAADHLASIVANKDCALWRPIKGRDMCKEREGDPNPYHVAYDQPERMVGEDGVHYVPPLRPTANAPAESWDAAAYKPTPPPAAPVTAGADASADPAPAPAQASPPKHKKHKARSAKKAAASSSKKPSRDQAATGS
jgi:hypothetical protein